MKIACWFVPNNSFMFREGIKQAFKQARGVVDGWSVCC